MNFLRVVGDFATGSRFRFIAGVQHSLVDNPSFRSVPEICDVIEKVDVLEARLATGATARETRDMVERLLTNRFIETLDEEGELIRLAADIREILDAEQATEHVPP